MVGQEGFEPSPFDYESNALNQLSYSPIFGAHGDVRDRITLRTKKRFYFKLRRQILSHNISINLVEHTRIELVLTGSEPAVLPLN